VGAVDPDAGRRERAASAWKVPVFAEFDEMLLDARPNVVVIGTPPDSHADYCMRSFAAGAHVICEKPFTSSIDEANAVIAAAAAANRRVALNHEFREMPIFRALRDAAARDGREVVFAQVWQLMDLPPWAEPGWRGQMLRRTLYEAGVHLVDFLMALFGERPVSVTASVSTCGVRESESDAVALCTLEFSRGRLAQIIQNRLCKGETQYFEVRAETGDASLRASFGGRARITAGLHRSTRPHLRVDYGVRKFDVATGENWSVYFRVVNTKAHQASSYYIVDLSARAPLIIMADSLDVGSGVRRREVWDETIASHKDVTEQVLAKLLDRAASEAGQR